MRIIRLHILSGRTQDTNLNFIAKNLQSLGIELREVRVVQDHRSTIENTLNALRVQDDYVFTTGGIGPTHDDITAECVAAAFNVELQVHPQARATLAQYYAERDIEFNSSRLRMARIPVGASLIDNPVSAAPGFRMENVFVFAGVPKIMQSMFDNCVAQLKRGMRIRSITVVCDLPEGVLAQPLGHLQGEFEDVDIGCYPGKSGAAGRVSIVLRSRQQAELEQAHQAVRQMVTSLQGTIE